MTAQFAIRMTEATRERVRAQLAAGSDDTNPAFLFSITHTALLLAIDGGLIDANQLARVELAQRGLNANDESQDSPAAETAVTEIARRLLHLDTIETRNADSLDFHELAVWSIRDALMAAYTAGAMAAGNGRAAGQEG